MIVQTYHTDRKLFDLFCCLHQEEDAVFLDSSLENQYGKYSIAGFLPEMKAEERNGKFYLNQQLQEGDCLDWVEQYLLLHKEENLSGLPFLSGGIGFLTYDYGKKFMKLPHVHEPYLDMPDCCFTFYRLYLIEETQTGKITISAKDPEALQWFWGKEFDTNRWQKAASRDNHICSMKVSSDFDPESYKEAIRKMVDYIVAGDIYITNMTRQIQIQSQADPFSLFCLLRKRNPSPFGAYFHFQDLEIICASPERFFEMRNGTIRTRPVKGTRRRGDNPKEDEQLRLELQNSEKDRSELLMIVDLERNDLSRICKPGSVQVEELFVTEAYATVFHLVSTISGELRQGKNAVDILRAMFPGGSITGAPKYRSMEIIDELERSRRMLYTGSLGYIGFDGDCDFNIVIRTLVHQNGCYHIGTGGGITCESDPDFEYEETCQKARALIDAARGASEKGQSRGS